MPKEARWPSPRRSAGRSATSRSTSTAGAATAASSAPADGPATWPGEILLLAAAALALRLSQLLGDGSCAYGVSVEQCLASRRRAALVQVTAVVAAHIVILGAIVVVAWLLSQPTPRHRKELLIRRRAWSGLAFALALAALFLWSVATQRGVIVDGFVD